MSARVGYVWLDLLKSRSSRGGIGVSFVVVSIGRVDSNFGTSTTFEEGVALLPSPLPRALFAMLVDRAASVGFWEVAGASGRAGGECYRDALGGGWIGWLIAPALFGAWLRIFSVLEMETLLGLFT